MAPHWFWLVIHFHLCIKILVSVTLILGAALVLRVFRKPAFLFSVTSPPAGQPNVRSIIDSRHWYPVLSNAGSTSSQQHRYGIWNKARQRKSNTQTHKRNKYGGCFWWELTDRLKRSVLLLYFLSLFYLMTREGGRRSRRMAETQFPPFRQGKYGFLYLLCDKICVAHVSSWNVSFFSSGPHNEFMDDTAEASCWVTVCLPPRSKHSIYRKQDVYSAPPRRRTNCDGLWLGFL